MYPSNTHTAAYRGNIQGHDNQWRSDSQQPTNYGTTGFVQSQYQGNQRNFQPTGTVQSYYGQQQQIGYPSNQMGTSAFGAYNTTGTNVQGQFANQYGSTQSFHTAQYHGNQSGHDEYLRADATQPSNRHMGMSSYQTGAFANQPGTGFHTAQYRPAFTSATGSMGSYAQQPAQQYGLPQASQQQMMNQTNTTMSMNPNAFHTSQYQGNQQGHDQYLRSDSNRGSQFGYGIRS